MKRKKRFKRDVMRAVSCYKDLIDSHCSIGDPTAALSLQFGVSRNILQLAFMNLYGENIREYKLRLRMERGCELLTFGLEVKEIAQDLNYTKTRAFTTAFKKYHGYTPTAFCNSLN
jgi:AraC-like DNA-binding protein